MFKALWVDIAAGRLRRLPYLGWDLLIVLIFVPAGLAIGLSLRLLEQAGEADIAATQALLAERFGVVGVVLLLFLPSDTLGLRRS